MVFSADHSKLSRTQVSVYLVWHSAMWFRWLFLSVGFQLSSYADDADGLLIVSSRYPLCKER